MLKCFFGHKWEITKEIVKEKWFETTYLLHYKFTEQHTIFFKKLTCKKCGKVKYRTSCSSLNYNWSEDDIKYELGEIKDG